MNPGTHSQSHTLLPWAPLVCPVRHTVQTLLPSVLENEPIGQGVQFTVSFVENLKPRLQQAHVLWPSGLACFVQELQPVPQPVLVKLRLSAAG